MLDPFDDTQVGAPAFAAAQVDPFEDTQNPTPQKDPGYAGDIWRGLKHGAAVTAPKAVGQAAQFFGLDSIGEKIVNWAQQNATAENAESEVGRAHDGAFSVRGNVYEAADNSVLSLAPGAAGAAGGAAIGSLVPGVGTAVGALIGYGVGSVASLPIFYGSQGQESFDKVRKAQLDRGASPEEAESAARAAGHGAGAIEAGGELISDVIPFGKLAKPFAKPAGKVAGNLVRDTFFPGLKEGAKTLAKIEAGEILTEMGQQAGESAVEGAYGAGPGATWDETKRVIMPTALMSLIPGGAGTVAHHVKLSSDAKALASAETDPETRAKIALGAASVLQEANPELARAFSAYAGEQIRAGAPIELGPDTLYEGRRQHQDALKAIGDAQSVDQAIDAAKASLDAPVAGGLLQSGAVDELELPSFDFQTSFPEPKPEVGMAPDQVAPAHAEIADVLRGALDRSEPETYARALEAYSQAFGETAALELDRAARGGTLPTLPADAQNGVRAEEPLPPNQEARPALGAEPLASLESARRDETGRDQGAGVPGRAVPAEPAQDVTGRAEPPPPQVGITPAPETETPAKAGVSAFEDFILGRTGEVKVFKSAKAAGLYAKQKSNRVPGNFVPREVEGEWRLSRPVRTRTEAQKANDRRLARQRANIDPAKDTLARMIGKLGGIKADELLRDGIDKATLKDFRSGIVGKPAYRTKGGLSLDALAELLNEYGFDVQDERGGIDASKLRELIQQELDGTPVYTPEGYERQASLAAEQREAEARMRAENDFTEDELAAAGYDGLSEGGRDAVAQAFEDGLDAEMDRLWNETGKVIADDDPLFGNLEKAEGATARREGEGGQRREEAPRDEKGPQKDAVTETPARAGVSLSSVPPALLKRITVSVEQLHDGEGVKTVQVPAEDALADVDREISAYEKLLACVRAA